MLKKDHASHQVEVQESADKTAKQFLPPNLTPDRCEKQACGYVNNLLRAASSVINSHTPRWLKTTPTYTSGESKSLRMRFDYYRRSSYLCDLFRDNINK